MNTMSNFAAIRWRARDITIEYQFIGAKSESAPLLVFLHEGLGSLAMWKEFPERVCAAGGFSGLVFSRPGYGLSTPRLDHEKWDVDFMHQQAEEVLPAFFSAIGLQKKPWLFGHSDGGSISLLYASKADTSVAGLVLMAPHIFVEDITVTNIEEARAAYISTDLPQKLARYHASADSAFWGWNDIWLHPTFRQWNIETALDAIRCPVLAIQGLDDAYGSLEQIRGIARRVPQTCLLELPDCGHSPHRDQAEKVIAETVSFINNQET